MALQERRAELYSLLGDLPDRRRPLSAKIESEERKEGYVLQKLTLDLNGIEPVPAYFTRPINHDDRLPIVMYNHSHGGEYQIGKDELLKGRRYTQPTPYVVDLTKLGYAVLCIDHWCFGERAHTSELDMFKLMLWRGQVLWGMMVYDSIRALDYVLTRPEIDPNRVASLGMSMGSTMAWWHAALDERIKVCVDLHCLTEFQSLIAAKGLAGHGIYYYVPSLLKHFSTLQINQMIAPRAHLAVQGNLDKLTPPSGLDMLDRELKKTYETAGAPDHWKMVRYDVPHQETPEGRQEVLKFLQRFL